MIVDSTVLDYYSAVLVSTLEREYSSREKIDDGVETTRTRQWFCVV